jgi:hypothetical protein
VDLCGRKGDLAGIAEDRGVHARCVLGFDERVDVLLDHLDAQPDQVDGLLEVDHPGQGAGRRTEHAGRKPGFG